MKIKLIFAGLLITALKTSAQWDNSTGATGTNPGIRVGSTASAPLGTTFHVGSGNGPLHYTGGGDGSMVIHGGPFGDRALLELHDPNQQNNTVFQALSYGTYLSAAVNKPIFLQTGGGNIGIGSGTSLNYKLDVQTNSLNDGIGVTNASSAAALHLTGSRHYAFLSDQSGNLKIYDYNGIQDRLIINSTGNVGIGSGVGFNNRLNVQASIPDDGIGITNSGGSAGLHLTSARHYAFLANSSGDLKIHDYISAQDRLIVTSTGNIGIGATPGSKLQVEETNASSGNYSAGRFTMYNNNQNIGIQAEVGSGSNNVAGRFIANNSTTGSNVGVYAIASQGPADYAGYFDGHVKIQNNLYVNGTAYCPAMAWSSDRMLKKDIRPIYNSLTKIAQLKPSSYNFRTDEFKAANLPDGPQLGLIAQELEEVFPELISEMNEQKNYDAKGNVTGSTPKHKAVNYVGLIPVLIGGIQEQQAEIDAQKIVIEKQQQVNSDLQNQIDELSQKLSTTTGINSMGENVTGFHLSQNEPNPFSYETVVKYTLPQSVNSASMYVYDLTGKQITTLPITEKGSSSITITSEKLSAGIYIYSIVADGKVIDSKRMIVAEK